MECNYYTDLSIQLANQEDYMDQLFSVYPLCLYSKLLPASIFKNPIELNRICNKIKNLGYDQLCEYLAESKNSEQQTGLSFRNWIKTGTMGIFPISESEFTKNNDNAILAGSDKALQEFAYKNLGYKRDKGLDFVARFNGKYVIGEAKFISAEGGHQDIEFLDAMEIFKTPVNKDVIPIAILDGVLYIKSKRKMYSKITSSDIPVFSALLLRDFLYQIH